MNLFTVLAARLRRSVEDRRRVKLVASIGLNVFLLLYALAYLPIIRLQPVCWDERALSIFNPTVEVDGELTEDFHVAYFKTLSNYYTDYYVSGNRIYVRLGTWLNREWLSNMSNKAVTALLMQRTGASLHDIWDQRLGIPLFDEINKGRWPPCEGVRKLAIEGGEWEHTGPIPRIAP